MTYAPNRDFFLEICKGNVPGHRFMNAMGEFQSGNISAAGEDVCRSEDVGGPARLPAPPDVGEQMTIVSTSTADAAAGLGVQTLRLEYLDATGAEQTEDITMNGTTDVNTVATNIRFVNDMYALTVGATGVSVGNITCIAFGGAIATDLYQFIVTGGNKSLVPHRMIPLGKTLHMQGWHCEEAQNKRAAFRLRSTDMNGVLIPGVFCFKDTAYLNQTTSGERNTRVAIPALSIIKVSYWAVQTNTEGACGWWGVLVDD